MESGTRTATPPTRAAVALLAGLYLAAAGSESLHLALSRHVLCARHGHLVHADGEGDPGAATPAPGTPADRDATRAVRAGGAATHEVCDLARHRPGDGAPDPGTIRAPLPAPLADPAGWPDAAAPATGSRPLSRAPKQSPPAS